MRSDGKRPDVAAASRLASTVRLRRRQLRLSQAELASLAGVGLAFLYDLERGKPTLRLDKVLSVLDVLGLELHVREGKALLTVATTLAEGH